MVGWFLIGLAGAALLHALWNGSAVFATDAIGLYFTVQVPIFIAACAHRAGCADKRCGSRGVGSAEYAAAGWLSAGEVDMLATPVGPTSGEGVGGRDGRRRERCRCAG